MGDRVIQTCCVLVVAGGVAAGGMLVPRMLQKARDQELRYTADPVEGAPPIVALGTAIGALRGIIADYLWIKLQSRKEQGLFYEAMADADLITKLQPRFAEVWAFHGHNMAYNISVLTNTPEERWAWVSAGIDLVRNRGLRYNPNDLGLNKELAFWFAHKIDGVADDAHLHYKREFAKEWHFVLGPPPMETADRERWLRAIADAPDTIEELEAKYPAVKDLEASLTRELSPFDRKFGFKLDREFLINLGRWQSSKESPYARLLGYDRRFLQNDPVYAAFDRVLGDPANVEARDRLVAFLRKKVLRDDYNMDPSLMADYTRDFGPFDWRHPQSHAFYFTKLGSTTGAKRYDDEDDVYKILNNDRICIQAMQALNHAGMMGVDPFSSDNPTRLHDNRWIKPIEKYFRELYQKHYKVRGAGGDTFIDFHENFMAQAIRQLYRSGDLEGAQEILDNLDKLYGRGGLIPSEKYHKPLEDFVRDTTYGEYEMVPDVARTDVYAALQRGLRDGLLMGNEKVMKDAMKFAKELTDYFQSTRYTDFVNKFGERRMADLVGDLRGSVENVFMALLQDRNQPLLDRLVMYNRAPDDLKRMAYDAVREQLAAELSQGPLSEIYRIEEVLPEPQGMEEHRRVQGELAEQRAREIEAQNRAGAHEEVMAILPPAILAIGRNYADHAKEMGGQVDPNPIIFMKNPASVIGDGQAIEIPPICRDHGPQVDYEGELAVEIGRDCRDVSPAEALSVVRAYRAANDVSARWWQKQGSGGQFCRGKSFDTFCPLGEPMPAAKVADPTRLRIRTRLNGQVMQDASTGLMFHGVRELLAMLSRGTTLLEGTIILTGSPAGVGSARTPPVFLKHGDTVEVEIEGVGRVSNPVRELP